MAAKKVPGQAFGGSALVRDPEIRIGDHLRVLQRTDGPFIIFDSRRKPGDSAMPDPDGKPLTFKTAAEAKQYAENTINGKDA